MAKAKRTSRKTKDDSGSQSAATVGFAAQTLGHSWRGQEGGKCKGVAGFCKFALLDEIRSLGRALPRGRYVRAEGVENDGEPIYVTPKAVRRGTQRAVRGLGPA